MQTNNWTAATQQVLRLQQPLGIASHLGRVGAAGQPAPGRCHCRRCANAGNAVAPPADSGVGMTQLASLTQQPQSRIPDGALLELANHAVAECPGLCPGGATDRPAAPRTLPRPKSAPSAPQPGSDYSKVSRPVSDGWYARRRDQAQAVLGGSAECSTTASRTQRHRSRAAERSASGAHAIEARPLMRFARAAGNAAPACRVGDRRRPPCSAGREPPAEQPLSSQRGPDGVARFGYGHGAT